MTTTAKDIEKCSDDFIFLSKDHNSSYDDLNIFGSVVKYIIAVFKCKTFYSDKCVISNDIFKDILPTHLEGYAEGIIKKVFKNLSDMGFKIVFYDYLNSFEMSSDDKSNHNDIVDCIVDCIIYNAECKAKLGLSCFFFNELYIKTITPEFNDGVDFRMEVFSKLDNLGFKVDYLTHNKFCYLLDWKKYRTQKYLKY